MRYIFKCDQINIILAGRAAKYGENEMPNKDAILVYGEAPDEVKFYVKRTKTGFTVTQMDACS